MNQWKLLYNPFTRIAGWQAFIVGLVFVTLSGIIGTFTHILFDGVIDAHTTDQTISIKTSLIVLAINIACISVAMYVSGIFVSRQTRFIDILGTMTLARFPLFLVAILGVLVTPVSMEEMMQNPMVLFGDPQFILFILLIIPLMVWFVALMFNALKVSTGKSGGKLIAAFVVGLIGAEVLSKVLIYFVLQ